MAEAVGLACSVLQLASTLTSVAKFITSLQVAPVELLSIHNDVINLTAVLKDVEQVVESLGEQSSTAKLSALAVEIQRAQESATILQDFIVNFQSSTWRPTRSIRWIAKKPQVKALQENLNMVRNRLLILLSAHNALSLNSINITVTKLHVQGEVLLADTLRIKNDSKEEGVDAPESSSLSASGLGSGKAESLRTLVDPRDSDAPVAVDFERCSMWCSCTCHRRSKISSPSLIEQAFGKVLVGYTGSLIGRTILCSETTCANSQKHQDSKTSKTNMTYYFPSWLLAKALNVQIMQLNLERTVCISMRNVIPLNSQLYYFAQSGKTKELKQLFQNRLARPNDIGGLSGDTALHDALRDNQIGSCRTLLQAGADPYIRNDSNVSAMDRAWKQILACEGSKEFLLELREIFPAGDHLDDWCLTSLHQIVLGLTGGSLENELQASTERINRQDSHGRTPLWWATCRGDLDATTVLLKYRADPHIADSEGFTPMHNAAKLGDIELTDSLLRAGGDPACWTNLQGHPIRWATWFHDDVDRLQPFITASVDLDDTSVGTGATALHRAAVHGLVKASALLLAHGAGIDVQNKAGESAIIRCLPHNHWKALKFLLDQGADHTVVTSKGDNILHSVAHWCDEVEIIDVLIAHGLPGLDPHARNGQNKTCIDILNGSTKILAFKSAFVSLIERLGPKECLIEMQEHGQLSNDSSSFLTSIDYTKTALGEGDEESEEFSDCCEVLIEV